MLAQAARSVYTGSANLTILLPPGTVDGCNTAYQSFVATPGPGTYSTLQTNCNNAVTAITPVGSLPCSSLCNFMSTGQSRMFSAGCRSKRALTTPTVDPGQRSLQPPALLRKHRPPLQPCRPTRCAAHIDSAPLFNSPFILNIFTGALVLICMHLPGICGHTSPLGQDMELQFACRKNIPGPQCDRHSAVRP